MSFANLKRQSGNFDKLKTAVEALSSKEEGSSKTENFWKPEVDKAGNGMAVIRFLPAPEADGDDALPWVKSFTHGFQGPGGQWLIDNCLTTLDKQCPVCEHNSTLWNSGIEANKDVVRKQKRKLNYIANVYIVNDPKHPETANKSLSNRNIGITCIVVGSLILLASSIWFYLVQRYKMAAAVNGVGQATNIITNTRITLKQPAKQACRSPVTGTLLRNHLLC